MIKKQEERSLVQKQFTEKSLDNIKVPENLNAGVPGSVPNLEDTLDINFFELEGQFVFEDSRVSKFQFELYRLVELARLSLLISSLFLSLIAYDGEFQNDQSFAQRLLLFAIFLQTIAIQILTAYAGYSIFRYQKTCNVVPSISSFHQTSYFQMMIIEMIIQIAHPSPFTQAIQISYEDNVTFQVYFYHLNEIFIYLLFFRTLIAFKLGLRMTYFSTSQVSRICKFYSISLDDGFIFKCLVRNFSFTLQFTIYVVGTFFFAVCYRISERPSVRTIDDNTGEYIYKYMSQPNNYNLALWVTTITIPTIGYGDFTPSTTLGRVSMTLCVIWGINMTSLFLASLIVTIGIEKGENLSFALMERILTREDLKKQAAQQITKMCRLFMMQKKSFLDPHKSHNLVSEMKHSRIFLKRSLRAYSHIDGENISDLIERNFTFMKQQCKLFQDELQVVSEYQDKIIQTLDHKTYMDVVEQSGEFKTSLASFQQSNSPNNAQNSDIKPFQTFQSFYFGKHEVNDIEIDPDYIKRSNIFKSRTSQQNLFVTRSKDQEYFEGLADENKDLEILYFDDELSIQDDTKNE